MIEHAILFRFRILWHILFWLCWYLFYSITFGSNISTYSVEFKVNLYLLVIRAFFTYAFIYYILPKFLFSKKYLSFTLISIVHAFLFGFCIWMFVEFYYRCLSCVFEEGFQVKNLSVIFFSIILNYPIPAIAAGVVIFKRWYKTQQHSVVLEKEKLEAELNFLKSQIHPHFLFNTLNNLYALTLIKSEKAPDVVIKLSELLDYMLYHSNEKEVNLQKEINQVQGYIELEKIRYGDRLNISFEINGELSGRYIAPMILIPFLENSFKHGISQSIHSPFIRITLDVNDIELKFNIKNSYSPAKSENNNLTEGIGLKNVQRRLELLYSGKHRLEISHTDSLFEVSLTLEFREFFNEPNLHG